jgi:hypothetical protein
MLINFLTVRNRRKISTQYLDKLEVAEFNYLMNLYLWRPLEVKNTPVKLGNAKIVSCLKLVRDRQKSSIKCQETTYIKLLSIGDVRHVPRRHLMGTITSAPFSGTQNRQ